MKRLCAIILTALSMAVRGQDSPVNPVHANVWTTNTAPIVTNVVQNIFNSYLGTAGVVTNNATFMVTFLDSIMADEVGSMLGYDVNGNNVIDSSGNLVGFTQVTNVIGITNFVTSIATNAPNIYNLTDYNSLKLNGALTWIATTNVIGSTNGAGQGTYFNSTSGNTWSNINNSVFTIVLSGTTYSYLSNGFTWWSTTRIDTNAWTLGASGGGTSPTTYIGGFWQMNGMTFNGYFNSTNANYNLTNAVANLSNSLPNLVSNQLSSVGISTNQYVASNIWYVAKSGNDTYAQAGQPFRPFLTITNAVKGAAVRFATTSERQEVFVLAGDYSDYNLLKKGVDIHGEVGANIIHKHLSTNDDSYGILDDRTCGATTNYIDWHGIMCFQGLTNTAGISNYWVSNPDYEDLNPPWNTNGVLTQGNATILLTNSGSCLIGYIDEVDAGNIFDDFVQYNCFNIINNNVSRLKVGVVRNPISGITFTVNDIDSGSADFTAVNVIGFYWELGETHIDCTINNVDNYAIWLNEPSTQSTEQHWFYSGDYLFSKIYISCLDKNYLGWFNFKYLNDNITGTSIGEPIAILGSGRWYFNGIEKIKSALSDVLNTSQASGVSNMEVWIDAEKFTATNGAFWIVANAGTIHASIKQFQAEDATSGGINIGGGSLYLDGQNANVGSGNALTFNLGYAEIKNLTLLSSNSSPIKVLTNGLNLQNVNLISGNGSASIASISPLNVGGEFSANTAPTNKITLFGTNYFGNVRVQGTVSGDGSGLTNSTKIYTTNIVNGATNQNITQRAIQISIPVIVTEPAGVIGQAEIIGQIGSSVTTWITVSEASLSGGITSIIATNEETFLIPVPPGWFWRTTNNVSGANYTAAIDNSGTKTNIVISFP